jgi:transcriptional regulator with XRE-family HTH domain
MMAVEKKPLKKFNQILKEMRTGRGMSLKDLAERARVPKHVVEEWEAGDKVPTRQQYNRITGVFQQLKFYEDTFDPEMTGRSSQPEIVTGSASQAPPVSPAKRSSGPLVVSLESLINHKVASMPANRTNDPELAAIQKELDAPKKNPWKSFGAGLMSCRVEVNASVNEIAELTGATASAVRGWENDPALPTRQYYDKIIDLFPQLRVIPVDIKDWVGVGRPRRINVVAQEPPKATTLLTGHDPDFLEQLRALEHNAQPDPEEDPIDTPAPMAVLDVVPNPHIGSTLDSMYEEMGELDEVKRLTDEKVAALDAQTEENKNMTLAQQEVSAAPHAVATREVQKQFIKKTIHAKRAVGNEFVEAYRTIHKFRELLRTGVKTTDVGQNVHDFFDQARQLDYSMEEAMELLLGED